MQIALDDLLLFLRVNNSEVCENKLACQEGLHGGALTKQVSPARSMQRPVAPVMLHPSSAKQVSPPCQTGSSSAKRVSLAKQARLVPRQVPSAIRVDPNREKNKDKDYFS